MKNQRLLRTKNKTFPQCIGCREKNEDLPVDKKSAKSGAISKSNPSYKSYPIIPLSFG